MSSNRSFLRVVVIVVIALIMAACGSSKDTSSSSAASGNVSIALTDAPAFGYDHVWITVNDIRFHASDTAGPGDGGWRKYPLDAPVTVDLLTLANGTTQTVWNALSLPTGQYQQIRLHLAPTFAQNPPAGHEFFNEVVVGANTYPLRIPDAQHGIMLAGSFAVVEGGTLRLAIDFDAGNDVVDARHNGVIEYVLKPRLAYFDLDDSGAILGRIDAIASGMAQTARFVIKAEQVGSLSTNNDVYTVRRATTVKADGSFILYPLKPGNYDIVMRGVNYQTVILRNVPVVKGSSPVAGATVIPQITMNAASTPDYSVRASIVSPTGAWIDFYQTLPGESASHQIRFRHFNPFTGAFSGFLMSSDSVRVGLYSTGTVTLAATTPVEGNGGYRAAADTILYDRGPFSMITSTMTGTVVFSALNVQPPASTRSISGSIVMSAGMMNQMDTGILFAVRGGMVVNTMSINGLIGQGGAYTMLNLPGGTVAQPRPGAVYGVEAVGWSAMSPTTVRALAVPAIADLRTSNATGTDLNMILMP